MTESGVSWQAACHLRGNDRRGMCRLWLLMLLLLSHQLLRDWLYIGSSCVCVWALQTLG